VNCRAHDPLGREIEARYAYIENRKLAVMEMSDAAGMKLLRPDEYDLDRASTFGVGEMLLDATRHGANEIIVGLGGSATNDGGFGMARALGFRFFEQEKELDGRVTDLVKLTQIVPSPQSSPSGRGGRVATGEGGVDSSALYRPSSAKIVAAVDVRNPLLGKNGATRIFGPQKGLRPDKIDMFEQALAKYADVVARDLHVDFRNEPGAGAAGGLGFGLMSFCGASIRQGFDIVAEVVGLESKMEDVDLIITGEGSLDRQTLEGKTPAGVARAARKLGKRVYVIVGRASEDREARGLFDGVYELGGSIPEAKQLLREKARELAKTL
jgi:glycerate kinase